MLWMSQSGIVLVDSTIHHLRFHLRFLLLSKAQHGVRGLIGAAAFVQLPDYYQQRHLIIGGCAQIILILDDSSEL